MLEESEIRERLSPNSISKSFLIDNSNHSEDSRTNLSSSQVTQNLLVTDHEESFCKFTFHGKANHASQKYPCATLKRQVEDNHNLLFYITFSHYFVDFYYVDETTLRGRVELQKLHLKKLIKNGDTFVREMNS